MAIWRENRALVWALGLMAGIHIVLLLIGSSPREMLVIIIASNLWRSGIAPILDCQGTSWYSRDRITQGRKGCGVAILRIQRVIFGFGLIF